VARNEITVVLEHVRSFATKHEVPIRPLTLLVGENSSGKSTFLAVASVLFGPGFPARPDFNDPPFALGTFETIATYKGGKYGRDVSFLVGFREARNGDGPRTVRATYARDRGRPGLIRFHGQTSRGRVELDLRGDSMSGEISYRSDRDGKPLSHSFPDLPDLVSPTSIGSITDLMASVGTALISRKSSAPVEVHNAYWLLGRALRSPFDQVVSFAPIRTRPKRTYDELSEDYSPEGDHIPKMLARLLNEERQTEQGRRVKEAVLRFGKESGLFRDVEVKKLGKGPDDPFQVQVAVGGPKVNLMDVGYGVSQALPLIVQSVLGRENGLLLVQQPEVHLHPRGQAALGTFFAQLVAAGGSTALIETHSDSLVDRVRYEVSQGTIKPEDVLILFFHKPKIETEIHPIEIDAFGNIDGAPDCYREFFLKEELRLLAPKANHVLDR